MHEGLNAFQGTYISRFLRFLKLYFIQFYYGWALPHASWFISRIEKENFIDVTSILQIGLK